jgi:GNAT superfamily N-acetyltransferase
VYSESRIRLRGLTAADVNALIPLLQAYMREAYDVTWSGTGAALRTDALGQRCRVLLATGIDGMLIGFLAWTRGYDLHHCVAGVDVLDLYVTPSRRSQGIGLALACMVAAEEEPSGVSYMKGTFLDRGAGLRLYERFAVCDQSGCIVAGRAFRRLAELAGRPIREIVRSLPERAWNYEA